MNRTADFTQAGGLYLTQDIFGFLQEGWANNFDALAAIIGEKVIVQGFNSLGGGNLSSGFAVVDGELLPFAGGAAAAYMYIDEQTATEQYDDGAAKNFYTTKELRFTASAGGNIPFTDFKRLPYSGTGGDIYAALNSIKTIFKNMVIESAVVLSGCAVTNVVGSNCDISAGVSLMDGEYVASAARIGGAFPCWLKADGTYVTAAPASPFIKFDYETSQRYVDVLRRSTNATGSVIMHRVLSNRFDVGTGLGKWEWLGWKICDAMANNVPVGYTRDASNPGGPAGDIWDVVNHTPGNTGGSKGHTVAENNIEEFTVTIPGSFDTPGIGYAVAGNDDTDGTIDITIGDPSPDEIDHRDPYLVMVYAERL